MIGGGAGGRPSPALVAGVNVVAVALAMLACQSGLPPATRTRRQLMVGTIAAVWVTRGTLWSGHPAEAAFRFYGCWVSAQPRTAEAYGPRLHSAAPAASRRGESSLCRVFSSFAVEGPSSSE